SVRAAYGQETGDGQFRPGQSEHFHCQRCVSRRGNQNHRDEPGFEWDLAGSSRPRHCRCCGGWAKSSKGTATNYFRPGGHPDGQPGCQLFIQASLRGSPGTSASVDGTFSRQLRLDTYSGAAEIIEASVDTECRLTP